jgi:uncharacterized protein DUF6167
MRRLFWVAVGAGTGVWATRKVTRITRMLTPRSIADRTTDRALGVGDRLRLFAEDVRYETHAREAELRAAVELDQNPPEMPQTGGRPVLKARYTVIDDDKDGH